jgi:hypothetical protein
LKIGFSAATASTLRPAFVNFPVRPINVAAQRAPLFFCQPAVGTLPVFWRSFGTAKIPLGLGLGLGLGLALKSARRLALRLDGEHTAGQAVPRTGGRRLRERRHDRQDCAYQDFHQP